MPATSAFFSGFAMYLFDVKMVRRVHDWKRIAAASVLGFAIGAYGSYQVQQTIPRSIDKDIMNAFDRKYMYTVLNSTGFGSNYIGSLDYSDSPQNKKPY